MYVISLPEDAGAAVLVVEIERIPTKIKTKENKRFITNEFKKPFLTHSGIGPPFDKVRWNLLSPSNYRRISRPLPQVSPSIPKHPQASPSKLDPKAGTAKL
jgi:hypothetical protein